MDPDKTPREPAIADRREVGHAGALGRPEPSPIAASSGHDAATITVGLVALILALWSVPHAIQAGDAGEFATVMLAGGVPHPSGYPWMRALGLVARGLWMLGLPPAIAAALPPALCGVVAWVLAQRCGRVLGRPWLGAGLACLAAASPLAIVHVNDSEVWGPHLLFSALFLLGVVRTRVDRRVTLGRAAGLGLALGLAVSHHLTAVLLIPLAIAAASPEREPSTSAWLRKLARHGAAGIGGSLLGLLAFASLAIGDGDGWRWGEVRTLAGLWHHVTRSDYGTFALSLHEQPVAASDTIARALASLGEVFSAGLVHAPIVGVVVLAAALAGCVALATKLGRPVALAWALCLLGATIGFPAAQNIDPNGPFGAWILERFDLLSVLLALVPVVAGLGFVVDATVERLPLRPRLVIVGGGAIAAVTMFAQIGATLERGRPRTEAAIEGAAIDMLETPDPDAPELVPGSPIRAIVFGTDDHRSFPAVYAQEVLGAGGHTLYIDAQLLAHPWYRARLRARAPWLPDIDKPLQLIGALWSDPELDAIPIYLANVFSAPAERLTKVPEGMLWRVALPPDHPAFVASEWSAEAIARRHLAAFARYRVSPADFAGLDHPRGHPWSADLWHAYVDKSRQLAVSLDRAQRPDDARRILAMLAERTGGE